MRLIITILTMLVSFSALAKPLSYYFEEDVKFDRLFQPRKRF